MKALNKHSNRWIAALATVGLLSAGVLAAWNRHLAAEIRRLDRAGLSVPIFVDDFTDSHAATETFDIPLPHPPPRPAQRPAQETPQPAPSIRTAEPATDQSDSDRRSLMQLALQNDPRARLALLRSMDIQIGFDDVLALTDGRQTSWALATVFNESGGKDSAALLAWAEGLPAGDDRQRAIQAVAHALSRQDPVALANWLWNLPESDGDRGRDQALTTTLRRMASTHPEDAEQWLEKMGADWPQASSIAAQLVRGRVQKDMNEAADWANALANGPLRDAAFGQLALRLAAQAPDAALEWCMAIENDTARQTAIGQIMPHWVRRQPEEAATWIETLPQGAMKDASVRGLINGLVNTSPETAALWVDTIENRGQRRAALGTVVSRWARTDPDRTAEWINGMPTGLVKDTALQHMALALTRTDPEAAMSWARSIQNGTMRKQAVQAVETRARHSRRR